MERLPKHVHASVRRALRQAWELDDAAKAEKLIRNLARRLERDAPGVAASILEGLDEILTVTRLGLPTELRRSLACTNIIENMMGTVRRVCRNVKRWRDASMALRWTAAAMNEAKKGFRRLKAYKQLPASRRSEASRETLNPRRPCSPSTPHNVNHGNDRFAMFNKERDIPVISSGMRPIGMVSGFREIIRKLGTGNCGSKNSRPPGAASRQTSNVERAIRTRQTFLMKAKNAPRRRG